MWQDIVRAQIRVFLNDIEGELYSDATLDKLAITAASIVVQEINLTTSYTIDFENQEISPDPSSDTIFINFIAIKAACLKSNWDFSTRISMDGVMAKLGPVHMNVNGAGSQALVALLNEGYCKMYQDLATKYNGNQISLVRAILSPFSHEDINTNF